MKGLKWRIIIVSFTVLFSIYLLIPSYLRFTKNINIPKISSPNDPWYYSVLPSQILKLGLDLRGGVHLVLGLNFDEIERNATVKLKTSLEELVQEETIQNVTVTATGDGKIVVRYPNEAAWEKLESFFGMNSALGENVDFESQSGTQAVLVMSDYYRQLVRDQAIEQSLETLRNRIDEFGIAEPIIQRHGEDKILVQFPGVREIGRLKDIIARTAQLSFNIVRSGPEVPEGTPSMAQVQNWVDAFVKENKIALTALNPITNYLDGLNKYLQGKIPEGTMLRFAKEENINTKEVEYIPYILDIEPIVSGDELEDARYAFKQDTNEPIVDFTLNPVGASRFEKGTGENVKGFMAIVLDNIVHSAPQIRSRIGGGKAIIEMGGSSGDVQKQLDDAKDTALVLRSGALPAKLQFLEERTMGFLGADAIRSGTRSMALGLLLVLIFMVIYYRASGLVASLALLLNALLILAFLAAFDGTLTLPGLAGITLTIGMAIDANVLIFEHIREELRSGKSVSMAIAEGYRRAFTAILDSNLTTVMAAFVLMSFGYGPIRGFAVTLVIGLACSMYTAVFATRVVMDYFIVSKGKKTISI